MSDDARPDPELVPVVNLGDDTDELIDLGEPDEFDPTDLSYYETFRAEHEKLVERHRNARRKIRNQTKALRELQKSYLAVRRLAQINTWRSRGQ